MGDFVEVPLPDGTSLIVQASDDDDRGGVVAAGRLHDVATAATQSFETAVDRLRSAAGSVVVQMRSMPKPPAEVTVEFGLKLATQAGVVVANATAEANLTVSLRWTFDTPDSTE